MENRNGQQSSVDAFMCHVINNSLSICINSKGEGRVIYYWGEGSTS